MTKENLLIVGGSNGLGLEVAKLYSDENNVYITGRRNPEVPRLNFTELNIGHNQKELANNLTQLVDTLPPIDLLIYAAGFFQDGRITDLTDEDIWTMNNVGLIAPELLLQRVLNSQEKLSGLIVITSTSEWIPRLREPAYAGTKAGLGHFAHSESLDPRIKKTLHVGPSGMQTNFWTETDRDTSTMLDPLWVAKQIYDQYKEDFKYRYVRILRGPSRVELIDETK